MSSTVGDGPSGLQKGSSAVNHQTEDDASMPVFSSSSASESMKAPNSRHTIERDEKEVQVLSQMEGILREPDAVMEPNILVSLGTYVSHKGSPTQAIEYMTDGYVGYAQIGSLLCRWLRLTEDEMHTSDTDVAPTPQETRLLSPGLSSPSNYSVMQRVKNAKHQNEDNGRRSREENRDTEHGDVEEVPDEAYFLRQLILERFTPLTFSGIFSKGGSGAPSWLNTLIEDPGGRKMIYDLSARYQNCLLLNFAVQKILMQPGRDEEVASQGVALSSYFGVFHRVLSVRLRAFAAADDDREVEDVANLIRQSALSSQLGYLHVQHMLRILAAEPSPWSCRFKRLYQELEIASKEPVAAKMSRFFAPLGDAEFLGASYIADILASASSGHVAPTSDVIKLHQLYTNAEKSPGVSLLHHPTLIQALMRGMFNPGKKLHSEAEKAYVDLLAISVAGLDEKGPFMLQSEVQNVQKVAKDACELGHKAMEDLVLNDSEKERAKESMKQYCCASGIVHLLKKRLTSQEYWSSAYHVHKEPPFLVLLYAIIEQQPPMRQEVFDLIRDALRTAGNSRQAIDVAEGLVHVLISLCKTSMCEEILGWAPEWARNADTHLARELIFGILEIASPPYSKYFVQKMLQTMAVSNVRRQSMGGRAWTARLPLLHEFYTHCADINGLDLGKAEASFFRELKIYCQRTS